MTSCMWAGGSRGRADLHSFVMGQATATWVGVGCFQITNEQLSWRLLCAIQAAPTLALVVGTFFMLESPRWLIANGRHEQAFAALRKLHGRGESAEEDDDIAQTASTSIRDQLELDAHFRTNLIGMLRHAPSRRRLFTGFATMAVNQCTGQTVVWSYSESDLCDSPCHGPL
jgi:hypothetical protein